MKKILGIFLIAGSLVACNDNAPSTENSKDSLDSVEKAKNDTIENRSDRMQDSVTMKTDAMKDSLDKKDSANAHK